VPKKAPSTTTAPQPAAVQPEPDDAAPEAAQGGGPHAPDEPDTAPLDSIDESAISDFEDEADYTAVVWWGQPGTGKTTNACSVLLSDSPGRLVVCNVEGGLKLRALRAQGIPTERISVWPRPGVRPTFDGLERLVLRMQAELDEDRAAGRPPRYCGIVWDSVTELVKTMLDNLLEEALTGKREAEQRARARGATVPVRSGKARFKLERDDYGLVSQQVRSILRKVKYMGLHFGVTALVRRDEDSDTGAVTYGPACPPALQGDLMGYADMVVETEVDEHGRFLGSSLAEPGRLRKDRYGVLPPELVDATHATILEYVVGKREREVAAAAEDDTETAPVEATETTEEPPAAPAPATTRRARTARGKA
jgi:hypothetical protein